MMMASVLVDKDIVTAMKGRMVATDVFAVMPETMLLLAGAMHSRACCTLRTRLLLSVGTLGSLHVSSSPRAPD